jgi:hypothetical protein
MPFKKGEPRLLFDGADDIYLLGIVGDDIRSDIVDVTGVIKHEAMARLQGISTKHAMLPHMLAKPDCSEHMEQCAFFCCLQIASEYYPQLNAAFAIGNGGSRGDTEMSRKIAGGKMKAEGVKPGVPDVCVPIPVGKYAGLFIEFKRLNGVPSDVSKDQEEWIANLSGVGYRVDVCYGWKHGMKTIREYFQI